MLMDQYRKNSKYLDDKYKNIVKIDSKSISELELYIAEKYDVKKIDTPTDNANKYKILFALNIINSALNYSYKLALEDLDIIVYKVMKSKKNEKYFLKDDNNYKFDNIYIYFELKTNSVYSNCSEINKLLLLEKGINQVDIDEKTNEYYLYLRLLDEKCSNDN